jgi:hypothetical protein
MRNVWILIGAMTAACVAAPAPAAVTAPPLCTADSINQMLIAAGKLTQEDVDNDAATSLIRCGDVTNDGTADALFTVASGGTAGDTHFGVFKGAPDGMSGSLILYRSAYKVGVARHNSRSFDVIQPHYAGDDPNCCPSSFRIRRYTWTAARFKTGKAKKVSSAPRRFYRP